MFNFLENDELLKEKNKKRKIEYRKELLLQIEQNKLKKLREKNILNNGKTKIINISKSFGNDNKLFFGRNGKFIKDMQRLKNSIDNSLIKSNINDKLNALKYNSSYKNYFNNLRISTESNYNQINHKNFLFKNNDKLTFTGKNIDLKQNKGHEMKKSLSQMIKSISFKYNNINNKSNYHNKNLMERIDIQILFKGFVEQQIKTINDYATNLENIFYLQYTKKDDNIILFNNLIKNEKNKALQSINNEKNKLKNKFGFFPMETIYDSRIEQLFNKILNKIISIYSSFNQIRINNYIHEENSNKNILPLKSKIPNKINEYDFPKISNIEINMNINKNFFPKFVKTNENIKKINIEDDLSFFDFWRKKYENEIMKEKNNLFDVNETIELKNINPKNNINENNLKIFPANNIFKNTKFRQFNRINKNKNLENEMKFPEISLKKHIFKRRNRSANSKISERVFSFI